MNVSRSAGPVAWQSGFSLPELLSCLALMTLLFSLAAPVFGRLLREAEMTRAVNSLVADVHRARQTAQLEARSVTLCASSSGRDCVDGMDWSDGWLVAVTGEVGGNDARVLSQVSRSRDTGIRIRANRRAFEFRPFTRRDTNGSLWFCDLQGEARQRRLVISPDRPTTPCFGTRF